MGLATLKIESLCVSQWFCLLFMGLFPHLVHGLVARLVQWILVRIYLSFLLFLQFLELLLPARIVLLLPPADLPMFL